MTADTATINLVSKIEKFIGKYITFSDASYSLPVALWVIGTFLWPDFDVFPYLVITSDTKRSGKSRLAELIGFCCSNPVPSGALTAAALYHTMAASQPTMFFDEAEVLSNEAANNMRAVLNMGYRKGQTVRRVIGNDVKEYPTYCPKCFILIGDVFDTLRDRSIVIRMRRGEPKERFVYDAAKGEGDAIREEIAAVLEAHKSEIINAYMNFKGLDFLTDRDEEVWSGLFVIASILTPGRVTELTRAAVDIATEKTALKRSYKDLEGAEQKAEEEEYSVRLLRDLYTVINGDKAITTADALDRLKNLPTAPWRKFRGAGLTAMDMAYLLNTHDVRPTTIQIGKGRKDRRVLKGYKREQVAVALKHI